MQYCAPLLPIIISPGPCRPVDAGHTLQIIEKCLASVPMLGVCLGHQAIIEVLGGEIVCAERPVHGKADQILHSGKHELFHDVPSPFAAGRYHSLIAPAQSLPPDLKVIGSNDEEVVMAVAHQRLPVFGIQFHPESILTEYGYQILHNFLTIAGIESNYDSQLHIQ